jgi:putative peptidoglycan lipid II flippase
MGLFLYGAQIWMGDTLTPSGHRYVGLAALCLAGFAVYGLAALIVGAMRPADFRAGLRRG